MLELQPVGVLGGDSVRGGGVDGVGGRAGGGAG